MTEISTVHQFIAAVCSTSHAFLCKPQSNNVKDLIQYILTYEIMATLQSGSYSGTNS